MWFFAELRRRNVFRVGAAYLVTAWLLVQVAGTLFPLFGFDHTPARTVVVVLAVGFVPTLVFAWAFRVTPGGLRRETDVDVAGLSPPPGESRRLDRWIMVGLALALALFAFDRFVLVPQRESARQASVASAIEQARREGRTQALLDAWGERSIAVLPFANMSDEPGSEYFADGLAEELLNLLARLPELRVISRSSAFSYKGREVRLPQVAEELGVAHVLEGSVRRVGDRLRITAQLIDARSDTHLWSETWDRTLGDIFAIQQEIALAVVERLRPSLLPGELPRPRETDPQAYALYLQARFLTHQASAESYAQAIELLQQVLAIDPGYLEAWDALAGNYVNQANRGLRPWAEGFALARQAAERALAADPDFAPAWRRLGWIALLQAGDLAAAAGHFQRALALAPSSPGVLGDAAVLLKGLGRIDECVLLDEYVVARDPVNPVSYFNLGGSYLFARRWDDAAQTLTTALRLAPGRVGGPYQLGLAELLGGDPAAALATMRREPLEVLRLLGETLALHALGERESADQRQAELIERFERDAAYNIAYVFAYRGGIDEAFDWLGRAVAYGDPGLADVVAEPLFDNLRGEPRWSAFLTGIGRGAGQLDAISFDVSLPGE